MAEITNLKQPKPKITPQLGKGIKKMP